MKLFAIDTMRFKVDGGAMFGVVPKMMWNKKYPADENNMCPCACRSLLIDTGKEIILVDTGIGDKLSKEELNYYEPNFDYGLKESLKSVGYSADDISHVVLTHLHFDHCGGSVEYDSKHNLVPTFENAFYYISNTHWKQATEPNRREKPSFVEDNFMPLFDQGKLKFIEDNCELISGVKLKIYNGHTAGLMGVEIITETKTIVFPGDMMPAAAYVPLSWISAYDLEPLVALEEKQKFLKEAYENQHIIFFQHDAFNECGTIKETNRGYRIDKLGTLKELIK